MLNHIITYRNSIYIPQFFVGAVPSDYGSQDAFLYLGNLQGYSMLTIGGIESLTSGTISGYDEYNNETIIVESLDNFVGKHDISSYCKLKIHIIDVSSNINFGSGSVIDIKITP